MKKLILIATIFGSLMNLGCGKQEKLQIAIERTCKNCQAAGIDINESNFIALEKIADTNFVDQFHVGDKLKVDVIGSDYSIIETGEIVLSQNDFDNGTITINTQ